MVPVLMALRGLFLRRKPARMNREQTKRCARRVPPLSGRIWCGGAKAALGFAPPPPGARLRWPGTPAPGQHQPHLIFGGQAWPPLARPPRCFLGGWCGGLLAVVGQAPASYIVGGGARGGPPGGRWLRRYRLCQVCALAESACLRPRRRGAAPARDLMPPLPPRRGGRRRDNGKEGSVRETQEGCPLPLKSVVFEAFSKLQILRQRGEKTFSTR